MPVSLIALLLGALYTALLYIYLLETEMTEMDKTKTTQFIKCKIQEKTPPSSRIQNSRIEPICAKFS